MPEYIIHIGPPKAGSKYLQTSLAARFAALKDLGVYYPVNDFTSGREVWHRALCERLRSRGDQELKRIFAGYNSSDYSYVVFSFEGFFGLSNDALMHLRSLIDDNPVRIVYYCRRLSERIPSLWIQNVKEGFSESFPQMYARALDDLLIAPDLNNRLVWERFEKIFGRDAIELVSFNNLVDSKTDLVEHFAETFLRLEELPPMDRKTDIDQNVSPDVYHTEILRVLNGIHIRRTGSRNDIVRRRFLSRKDDSYIDLLTSLMENDLSSIMINENRPLFVLLQKEAASFKDRIVNPTAGGSFFVLKPVEFNFLRQDYLVEKAACETISALYDELTTA